MPAFRRSLSQHFVPLHKDEGQQHFVPPQATAIVVNVHHKEKAAVAGGAGGVAGGKVWHISVDMFVYALCVLCLYCGSGILGSAAWPLAGPEPQ